LRGQLKKKGRNSRKLKTKGVKQKIFSRTAKKMNNAKENPRKGASGGGLVRSMVSTEALKG